MCLSLALTVLFVLPGKRLSVSSLRVEMVEESVSVPTGGLGPLQGEG